MTIILPVHGCQPWHELFQRVELHSYMCDVHSDCRCSNRSWEALGPPSLVCLIALCVASQRQAAPFPSLGNPKKALGILHLNVMCSVIHSGGLKTRGPCS